MSHTEGNDLAGSNSEPTRGQLKSAQPPHNNRPDTFKTLAGFYGYYYYFQDTGTGSQPVIYIGSSL